MKALALALMVVATAAAAQDREPPRVSADRNGRTEVVVDGDCVVNFDARGQRTRYSSECRDGQLRRAERADSRWREERASGGGREPDDDRQPRITVQRDGQARVDVGRDCEVIYGADGRRRTLSPNCNTRELARADSAMVEYLREREPRVTMLQGGFARIAVGRDCEVNYDRDGSRRGQAQGCSGRDIALADRSMVEYRRQHGFDRPQQRPGVVTPIPGRGGRGDERPGHGKGDVQIQDDGAGSVTFTNGCVVTYATDGTRRGAVRLCSQGQVGRADELYETFRLLKQAPRN